MMVIGVIDTGVDKEHKRLSKAKIEGVTIYKKKDEEIVKIKGEFKDYKGHGTGIVSIINRHVPTAEFKIVKLDSYSSKVSEDILEQAILYLLEETKVKIINISMGVNTNSPSLGLKRACEYALERGVVIIASAYYKHDSLCFPAHFKSVFSVGTGIVKSKRDFRYLDENLTNILCKGGFQRVAVPGNQFSFSAGTSLATAHFTGIIATAYEDETWTDMDSLKEWLVKYSNKEIVSFTKHDKSENLVESLASPEKNLDIQDIISMPEEIEKIAIFPFEEKEMKTLIEFKDDLEYSLELAIGYPRSIKLDKTVELLIEKDVLFVSKLPSSSQYDLFDTIVIGYFLDKLSDHNSFFGYSLIKECIERNKNFIVWDKTIYELIQHLVKNEQYKYTGKIILTSFEEDKKNLLFASMDYFELHKPSICVIGTGSRQGKFTTQLILKRILRENGYKVSHLSTEPQGILFNSSCIFPIGHNGTVSIDLKDWNKTLRFLTQYIEDSEKPDIVLTGSQGGILPLHPVNDSSSLEKLAYVKAFYPDAIVCTISPNDSIDFVEKTIATVQSFIKTEVLFYVLTPYKYKFYHGKDNAIVSFEKVDEEEYDKLLDFYSEKLGKKVVNIKDKSNYSFMINSIVNFFSRDKYLINSN